MPADAPSDPKVTSATDPVDDESPVTVVSGTATSAVSSAVEPTVGPSTGSGNMNMLLIPWGTDSPDGDAGDGDDSDVSSDDDVSSAAGSTGGGNSSSSTGGDGSSSNDDDSDEAEGPDEPDESTVVRTETEQGISMEIRNATASDTSTVPIELAGPADTSPAVTVSSLTVVPADGTDLLSGTVSRPSASPDPLPQVPRGAVLAYVHADVDENVTADDPVGYVLFDYAVDPDAIPEGLDANDLLILRYAEGEWTQSDVNERTEDNETSVALPELGPFAVVAYEPGSVEVVDADLDTDWILAGHRTTVQVVVRNGGDRQATRTIPVEVDGRTVAEREVTVEPGERTAVPIRFEPHDSGIVSVDGIDAGMLETGEPGEEPDDVASTTADDAPGFGFTVGVAALFVVVVTVLRRQNP